jgi:hypothetical protein
MRVPLPVLSASENAHQLDGAALKLDVCLEAAQCRAHAAELAGRPEEAILMRIAHAFETLDT